MPSGPSRRGAGSFRDGAPGARLSQDERNGRADRFRGPPPNGSPFDDQVDEEENPYERSATADPNVIDASEIIGVPKARSLALPWFDKIVNSVEEEQNPIRVTLAQVTSQSGSEEVTTIEHDHDTPTGETIDQLLRIAVDDMCGGHFTGKKISYSLAVTLQTGKKERFTFVLEQPHVKDALAEPPARHHFPDPTGAMGMFMEQNLQLTRFALENASTGKKEQAEMIRELRQENHYLKRSQFARDREMQILLDANLQRDFLVKEHHAKIERDAKIGEGFKIIAPQLLKLALPPQMAQSIESIAGVGAMAAGAATQAAQQATQQRQARTGDARRDTDTDDDMSTSSEEELVDELIFELEKDQDFVMELMSLMQKKPRCGEILMGLYAASRERQSASQG